MADFEKLINEGEKVKDWEGGIVVEFEDRYYWLNTDKGKVVMEGNFL